MFSTSTLGSVYSYIDFLVFLQGEQAAYFQTITRKDE